MKTDVKPELAIISELQDLIIELEVRLAACKHAQEALIGISPCYFEKETQEPIIVKTDLVKPFVIAEKVCTECQKAYKPTSNVQKRCKECRSKKVNKNHVPAD